MYLFDFVYQKICNKFGSYSLSVDIVDCPSVISVGLIVCLETVVSVGSDWSDTLAVPIVGKVVTP